MWMTRVSIAQPVFAAMVMLALCVLGIFSYARLGVEQLPDIKPPVAFIDIRYPGASPEAVEREITRRVDEAVNGVAGVKRITSRAFEGRSQTSVEFSLNADMGRAVQDVRDRVALVQPVFPKDAKAPVIARANNENAQPVAVFALLSPSKSPRELSMIAELLVSRRFQRVDGVSSVELAGLATREVRVDLSIERLQQFGITAAEIAAALKEQNNDQPVGLLSNPTSDAMLRVEGRVNDPLDFANFMIAKRDGIAVLLSDLGRVYERERELDTLARINGQRAVSFNVFKQQDANIVATGDAIKQAADELRPLLGDDVELRLIYASSDWVKQSLNGLQRTLIEGAVLTVLIVYLFLHSWRSTVITGLTLPIAVISSFIAVYAFGFTLNFMTMMALSPVSYTHLTLPT
ncbi:MAG: efflux RND transporter permease subunit, partial [Betaproteobacteria bacterium]|nr:efflux RND transporter permease subunit [Betaproteobacteria bacterium]